MRALRVDFAPAPVWRRWACWGSVVASCVFAGMSSWQAWKDWGTLQASEQALQQVLRQQSEALLKERALETELAKPKPYAKDAAEAVRIALFPIDQVLHALEVTQMEGVRVTAIDLHPDAGTAHVELEFDDAGQLMKYLEQLNAGDEKPRWVLQQAKMAPKAMGAATGGTASLVSSWPSTELAAYR